MVVSLQLFSPNFSEGDPKLYEELDGAFCVTWSGGSDPIFPEVSALVVSCVFLQYPLFLLVLWGIDGNYLVITLFSLR